MKWCPTMKNNSTPHKQQGFTLVEILVAITIGLVMLTGVLQVSQANKESSRLQRNMGYVQQNIRSAMDLLIRDIRQAGFYVDDDSGNRILTAPNPFINVSNSSTTSVATAITADGGGAENDQITLTYESDLDCLNQATPPATTAPVTGNRFAVNHYYIANKRLMCRGNGASGTAPGQALVEGVESLQILYGENTDGDPRSANRYVRAEQVSDMANVVSVRIGMRFISRESIRQQTDTNRYALLDASAFQPASGDRLLRREITTTISLRNNQ